MSADRESSFKFYSFGIVAIDKGRNSPFIKVAPIEEISLSTQKSEDTKVKTNSEKRPSTKYKVDEEIKVIKDKTITYSVEAADHKRIVRTETLNGDMMMIATWIPFGQSNRITAPDVIEGETVMIFRVADTDEYYWTTIMHEPSIRRQETVCYIFGNKPDKDLIAWDKESSYWIEVSTHDKYVHLHTAKNDGETAAWDIKLDTAKGIFNITDNAGNELIIDNPAGKLTGNFVDSVEFNTKKFIVNASESTTFNTPITTMNGDQHVTGTSALDGAVTTGSSVSVGAGLSTGASGGGSTSIGGELSIDGNVSGSGSLAVSGRVSASNVT